MAPPGSEFSIMQLIEALKWKVTQLNSCLDLSIGECNEAQENLTQITSAIRSRQNSYAPIHNLPAEIIAEIMCYAIDNIWQRSYAWIRLTHVSRYWRNSTIAFPCVWNRIILRDIRAMRLLFARSKDANITVDLQISRTYMNLQEREEFLEIFMQNTARMEVLTCDLPNDVNFTTKFWSHLAECEAPKLEKLTISLPSTRAGHSAQHTFPVIFRNYLPRLTTIDITGVSIWPSDHPFRNLSHITLRCQPQADSTRSVSVFLDFLEQSPRLQQLSLYLSASNISDCPDRLLRLVDLTAFSLDTESCADAVTLLSHLALPKVRNLKINVLGNGEDWLFEPLPHDLSLLGDIPTLSSALFMRHSEGSCVVAVGGNTSVSISRAHNRQIPASLRPFLPLPLITNLQNICIAGACRYGPISLTLETGTSHLSACLRDLTSLQSLVLVESREAPFILATLTMLYDDGSIACPSLKEVELVYHPGMNPDLLKFVRERKNMGYPVHSLTIIHEECRVQAEVEQLRNGLEIDVFTILADSATVNAARKMYMSLEHVSLMRGWAV